MVTLKRVFALFVLMFSMNVTAELNISVNKNPVALNKPITLTVAIDKRTAQEAFDIQALLGQFGNDVIIGRTSTSSNAQYINGVSSVSTRWQTTVIFTKVGHYPLPSITIDGEQSRPITIKVVPKSDEFEPVKLSTQWSATERYLGQPLTLTVDILVNGQLESGSITPINSSDISIEQLGDNERSSVMIDGVNYNKITQRYLVIPQQVGQYPSPAIRFQGSLSVGAARGFFRNGPSEPIFLQSEAVSLNIKAAPAGTAFVADQVKISDSITGDESITQGAPITRTITVTALNGDIPTLSFDGPIEGANLFSEKPKLEQFLQDGHLINKQIYTIAIVPTQSGSLTLPKITLDWFNANSDSRESATIEAKTLTVKASEITAAIAPSATQANCPAPEKAPDTPESADANRASTSNSGSAFWFWCAMGLLISQLLTLLLLLRNRRAKSETVEPQEQASPARAQMVAALATNRSHAILRNLVNYATSRQGRPTTLTELRAEPNLAQWLDALQKQEYGGETANLAPITIRQLDEWLNKCARAPSQGWQLNP